MLRKTLRGTKSIAFLALFLWSTVAIMLSKGLNNIKVSVILFPTFLISSTLIYLKILLNREPQKTSFKTIFPKKKLTRFSGIFLMFGYHLFLFKGLKTSPKVETNLVNFLWPLLMILFGYIIFNNKNIYKKVKTTLGNGSKIIKPDDINIDAYGFLQIIFAFIGLVLITTHGDFNHISFASWQGPLLGLIAANCLAILSIILKFQGNTSYISSFIFGTTFLSGLFWAGQDFPNLLNTKTLLISLYLGLFPFGIAMLLWESAIKRGCTHEIATFSFIAPFLSTCLLFIFGYDNVNTYSFIGFILIIVANMKRGSLLEILKTGKPKVIPENIIFVKDGEHKLSNFTKRNVHHLNKSESGDH